MYLKIKINLLFLLIFSFYAQGQRKNVLFVMVDDLNTMIGPYGDPQAITPNMDKLASKSTIFMNANCTAPICGPSRTSILTGKYPTSTKIYENSPHFRDKPGNENIVTLPQYFNSFGYETISGGKIFHKPRGNSAVPNPKSDPASFDIQHKGTMGTKKPPEADRFQHGLNLDQPGIGPFFKQQFDYFPVEIDFSGNVQTLESTFDFKSLDFVADLIENRPANAAPFFAAAGTLRPHMPLYCPKKYFDMYDINTIILPDIAMNPNIDDMSDVQVSDTWSALHNEVKDKDLWKNFVLAYLANITFADDCVGNLLDSLENSPFKDNTIIVFMSDHGFHVGEKDFWTKPTFWEEVARVPLMIYDPSNPVGQVVDRPVSLVDVYPTLIDLAELPEKDDLDGVSFKRLMDSPNMDWKRYALTSRNANNHTLRSQDFRYIKRVIGNGLIAEELYDHRNDPHEWNNLIDKATGLPDPGYEDIVRDHKERLNKSALNGDYSVLFEEGTLSVNDVISKTNVEFNINNVGLRVYSNKELDNNAQLLIYNMEGKEVMSSKSIANTNKFDLKLSFLSHGIYVAKLKNGINVDTFKFIW